LFSSKSFFGGFVPGFRDYFQPAGNVTGAAAARMQRNAERASDDIPGLLCTDGKRYQWGKVIYFIALRNNLQRHFVFSRGNFFGSY
jgi:hypothetical protein